MNSDAKLDKVLVGVESVQADVSVMQSDVSAIQSDLTGIKLKQTGLALRMQEIEERTSDLSKIRAGQLKLQETLDAHLAHLDKVLRLLAGTEGGDA